MTNNNDYYYHYCMNERKFSAKREAILETLKSTKTHPGVHWIFEELKKKIPDLSLATVYRNIKIFCQEGKALSLGSVNGEERFDGIPETHPHFICSNCGAVHDLPPKIAKNLLKKIFYEEKSYFIDFPKTVFYGLCMDCQTFGSQSRGSPPDAA